MVYLLLLYEGPFRYVPSYIGPVGRGLFVACSGRPQHTARISASFDKVAQLYGDSMAGPLASQPHSQARVSTEFHSWMGRRLYIAGHDALDEMPVNVEPGLNAS